jgi:hypothetical protein
MFVNPISIMGKIAPPIVIIYNKYKYIYIKTKISYIYKVVIILGANFAQIEFKGENSNLLSKKIFILAVACR